MRRLTLVLGAAAIMGMSVAAGDALAASEHYFAGSLTPQRVYASASAHSGVTYTQAVAVNTKCPGIAQGAAGYFTYGAAGTALAWNVNACSTGTIGWYPPAYSGFWHGATYNPNGATTVTVTDAHYSW